MDVTPTMSLFFSIFIFFRMRAPLGRTRLLSSKLSISRIGNRVVICEQALDNKGDPVVVRQGISWKQASPCFISSD